MDVKLIVVVIFLLYGQVICRRLSRAADEKADDNADDTALATDDTGNAKSSSFSKSYDMSDNEIDEYITTEPPFTTTTETPLNEDEETARKASSDETDDGADVDSSSEEEIKKGKKQNKKVKLDPIDEFLLQGLLDVVDEKFSSISKRMITLERAVNNIQYYSVRSFRMVNTHLHALDTILHGMHSEINQVDLQNRAMEQGIGMVKRDVADLQSMNSEMFEAIEQNLVHFHKDVKSRMTEVKADIFANKGQILKIQNDTAEMKEDIHDLKRSSSEIIQNTELLFLSSTEIFKTQGNLTNASSVILKTTEDLVMNTEGVIQSTASLARTVSNLDIKADEIRATVTEVVSNMSLTSSSLSSGDTLKSGPETDNVFQSGDEAEERSNFQELRVSSSKAQMTCGGLIEYLEEKFRYLEDSRNLTTQNKSCMWPDSDDFKNTSQTLIRALATVNENVLHSLSYYRHTGDLIERVLADTELVASEQLKLREDLQDFIGNSSIYFEGRNFSYIDPTLDSGEDCAIAETVVAEINKIAKNNTQLVELLTDLAAISSSSMKTSLSELNKEITRLNTVQESNRNSIFGNAEALTREPEVTLTGHQGQIKDIHNRTEWIYQFVEAIASNTGWIPYIFHNMRFVENQVNKTLKLSNDIFQNSEEILKRQRATSPAPPPPPGTVTSNPQITKQQLLNSQNAIIKPTLASLQQNLPQSKVGHDVTQTNMSAMGNMMEFVFDTNVKLDRLLPALTNLLGEPEPYISLVNGKTDREGRVEIYFKGRWGTICDNMGNIEASYVCRSLGYLGGISAGSGYFGPGSEDSVFWSLNVTCLRTRWCEAVSPVNEPEACNHNNDFAVICDHMVRLTPSEENEGSRNIGMVEMYHDNRWSPVCSRGWGGNETQVVCRQLGFRNGNFTEVKDDTKTDTHWLTNVTCKGSEERLDTCALGGFDYNGCPDFKFISVVCA